MFTNRYRRLDTVTKALNIGRLMGDNTSVYFNKIKTAIARDRVAMSFISDRAIVSDNIFTNTIIQVTDRHIMNRTEEAKRLDLDFSRQYIDLFKSTSVLNYEAAMALIYKIRIDGYIVTDIANINNGNEAEFISVEELNCDSEIIKISVSDRVIPIVDTIMERSKFRMDEKHTSRIISIESDIEGLSAFENVVELAFNKTFNIENIYNIVSESDRGYRILCSSNVACVISNNTITLVSTSNRLDCDNMCNALRNILDSHEYEYKLNMTGELIML